MSKQIKIKRNFGYADKMRPYEIVLDGKIIGEVKNNETVVLHISGDTHSLNMKIDWCRSNIINFQSDQEVTEFECKSNLSGFKIMLAIFYVIFLRDQYILLAQIK